MMEMFDKKLRLVLPNSCIWTFDQVGTTGVLIPELLLCLGDLMSNDVLGEVFGNKSISYISRYPEQLNR